MERHRELCERIERLVRGSTLHVEILLRQPIYAPKTDIAPPAAIIITKNQRWPDTVVTSILRDATVMPTNAPMNRYRDKYLDFMYRVETKPPTSNGTTFNKPIYHPAMLGM